MKPAAFRYCRPATVEEALEALAEHGEEAKVLAGGQSLVPLLNLRVIRPGVIVDVNGVDGLDQVVHENGAVRIGAMARQRRLELDGGVENRLPLLHEALGFVAHIPIRTRGTVGGSVAHADPAAEIPAVTVALGATMHVRGQDDARAIPASDFYIGPFTTAISPTELLVAIELPALPQGAGWAFLEVARVHGAFALVGVAALLHAADDGTLADARLALCGVGGTPVAIPGVREIAAGEAPTEELFETLAEHVRKTIDPFTDTQASAEYRREVAGALVVRALRLASHRAGAEGKE
ncbi:MAG TPA: xanthine dehydrogenase family protein subunit M [Gaiellaceae bacterium]|nr:xanthine dehydrogenase family protein subunit M [Gaiellaceae bacterium]